MNAAKDRGSEGQPAGGRSTRSARAEGEARPGGESQPASEPAPSAGAAPRPLLDHLYESAASLQEVVPDATLVGGSAAAFYAGHRDSFDHDHVLADLADHFDMVLEAIESQDGWVTNRVVPNKLILGELGDFEAGVRQLIRKVPLEVARYQLPSGRILQVPTAEETLRIKGYLIVARNQTRDYLDVAALSEWMSLDRAGATLSSIDAYYGDQRNDGVGVASQLVRQLADPRPKDSRTTKRLADYKRLDIRWQDWNQVRAVCAAIALAMVEGKT